VVILEHSISRETLDVEYIAKGHCVFTD